MITFQNFNYFKAWCWNKQISKQAVPDTDKQISYAGCIYYILLYEYKNGFASSGIL